jgi:hypothetical protein
VDGPPCQRPMKHAPALRSHGRACGAAFGAAHPVPARPFHGGSHRCLSSFRHLTEFGAVSSSQCPPGARPRAMAFRAARDRQACRHRSKSDAVQCVSSSRCIYRCRYSCPYAEAMAADGKNLLFGARERIRSVAPLCPACGAALAAGHHGCALTCQAAICLACSRHTALNCIA